MTLDPRIRLPRTTDREPTQAELRASLNAQAPGGRLDVDPNAHPRIQQLQRSMGGGRTLEELAAGRGRKRTQHEQAEQEALTVKARTRWWWRGYRHIAQERATGTANEGGRLKRLGVKAGTSDVEVMVPAIRSRYDKRKIERGGTIVKLELKAGRNKTTPSQDEYLDLARRLSIPGVHACVCYGHEQALETIDRLVGPAPIDKHEYCDWPSVAGGPDDWSGA